MTLALILIFSLLGSVGAVLVAGVLFRVRREFSTRLKTAVLSYATGSLLGAAFLGMIPHALAELPAPRVLGTVLAGIVGFFVLEKLLVWRHCHEHDCRAHAQTGPLILVGDAVHNAIDGMAIALAFQQSWALGIGTAFAVIAHEIPQEIGDIMILVHHGWPRKRAMLYNLLASLTTIPGALVAYWAGSRIDDLAPYALSVSAASFLYIALADLTPDHRTHPRLAATVLQLAGIGAGIGTIVLVHSLRH
ncbi:MAG TPA: ZIP family metal transporter [Opitutaceae bacterium]|nr:ZIP family metal transporter [Opitutaceae bacterium]